MSGALMVNSYARGALNGLKKDGHNHGTSPYHFLMQMGVHMSSTSMVNWYARGALNGLKKVLTTVAHPIPLSNISAPPSPGTYMYANHSDASFYGKYFLKWLEIS